MKLRDTSIRFPAAIGVFAMALLLGGVGLWSVRTEISGAVIAQGTIQVENRSQIVQHPDGGVVGEILARDGDVVASGDVLLQLDGTFLRTELSIIERQLADIFAQGTRLVAERDDTDALVPAEFPQFVTVAGGDLEEQLERQRTLFEARQASLEQETQILREQEGQIRRRIEGIEANIAALRQQSSLTAEDAEALDTLVGQGLARATQLNAVLRDAARLDGEIARLQSEAAAAGVRINELELEGLRLSTVRREEAISRLRDLDFAEIELLERRLSLIERLERLDIRAPVGGTVFGTTVFAQQAVVSPAEPIMYIVPDDQPLQVAAQIDPLDIDQVTAGQDATLVFATFNRRETPEVQGQVLRVSADATRDEVSGRTYYEAVIAPDADEIEKLGDVSLIPGMPVEAYLRTDARTPLSYLVEPLSTYFRRAFREE